MEYEPVMISLPPPSPPPPLLYISSQWKVALLHKVKLIFLSIIILACLNFILSAYVFEVSIKLVFGSLCFQTAVELNNELMTEAKRMNYPSNPFSSFAYDAIWSIALTLQKSSPFLKARNKSLSNITYGDLETAELFRRVLRNLTFTGMSVSICINRSIANKNKVDVTQPCF